MAKAKKGYNCNTWIKDKGKLKPIFWESKDLAIAYLKDTINSMEKGTVTKVECFFEKSAKLLRVGVGSLTLLTVV